METGSWRVDGAYLIQAKDASGHGILQCYTRFAMETLAPPTAREVYAQLSQGREIMRMISIMAIFGLAGVTFFRPPWAHNGELISLVLQAGLVAALVGIGFWQVKKHETVETIAWQKAWRAKLDLAGYEVAMATLRQENLDPDSAQAIRDWMAKRASTTP